MNFVRTINWTIFNWDELSHIDYENVCHGSKNREHIYPYFHLKSGIKLDAFESPDSFTLEEDGQEYFFSSKCCTVCSEILLNMIIISQVDGQMLFDVEANDDKIWDKFIEWAKTQTDLEKLTRY